MSMFNERGMSYFRACVSPDLKALNLTVDVDDYKFCEGLSADQLALPIPQVNVSSDVSDP
jgi:hypothetical protein